MATLTLKSSGFPQKAKYGVVMTSYGRDSLLKTAISSVLHQSYTDFLLLIVDDNSSVINPRTVPIIQNYADKDNRIVFFETDTGRHERQSVSTFCRNINYMLEILLKKFDVQYVSYLPCDDQWRPDRLRVIDAYLTAHPETKICYNRILNTDASKRKKWEVPQQRGIVHNPVCVLDHSCVTHRLDLIKQLAKPWWPLNKVTESFAPDGEFFLKLISVGGPIVPVGNQILGDKLIHADSIQGRRSK